MTRRLVVSKAAEAESEEQAGHYAEQAGVEVALRFVAELEVIYRALLDDRIVGVSHPQVRSQKSVKRAFMKRFPFAVVFLVDRDIVRIVAVESLRRRPGYWRKRLR